MSKHNHKCSCDHEAVKFCKCCNTVYCTDCNQEWTAKSSYGWTNPWYSTTYGLGSAGPTYNGSETLCATKNVAGGQAVTSGTFDSAQAIKEAYAQACQNKG